MASIAAKRVKPAARVLGALDIKKISDANIKKAIDLVLKEYEKAGGTDQVAKGADFVEVIRKKVMDGLRKLDS